MKIISNNKLFILGISLILVMVIDLGFSRTKNSYRPSDLSKLKAPQTGIHYNTCAIGVDGQYCYVAGITPGQRLILRKIDKRNIKEAKTTKELYY